MLRPARPHARRASHAGQAGRSARVAALAGTALLALTGAVAACSADQGRIRASGEGIDASSLPPEVRPSYQVFAHRCSKCHSLARALQSGIDDDQYWAMYVQRMKRQPGSGISDSDEVIILRFLSFYSAELRRTKASPEGSSHSAPASDQALRKP